jgi:anthranilate phosphoribosyltransferase
VRTIFNLLGPLTNPAGARRQVLGVFHMDWVEPLADVLLKLGSEHVLVVHAEDGLDEISIGAPTRIAELHHGKISVYSVTPEQFGLERGDVNALKVSNAQASLAMIEAVLANQSGAARDIVALNAGAAIYVAGLAPSLKGGVEKAQQVMASGAAKEKLAALKAFSNTFKMGSTGA